MELSQEMQKTIANFSFNNKQMEIFRYLEQQLKQGNTSAHAILTYARISYWDKLQGSPFVISAPIINYLGFAIETLKDNEQQKLAPQFYLLAAQRQSSWGNINYACCLLYGKFDLQKSPQEALKFARTAVELAQNNPSEKHEHKFILCRSLRANQLFREANFALIDFLYFKFYQANLEKDVNTKKTFEKAIEDSLILCEKIIDEHYITLIEADRDKLTIEYCQSKLTELEPIISYEVKHNKFLALKQKALFINGQYCEKLNQHQNAWTIYSSITDEKLPFYKEVIAARALLLKRQVNIFAIDSILLELHVLNINEDNKNNLCAEKQKYSTLMLPQGIPLPANFNTYWSKETQWFDSVDIESIKIEYKKRLEQLEKFITIKKEEISLIGEVLKDLETSDVLIAKKQLINGELEELQSLKSNLNEKYSTYLPEKRKTYRSQAAQTHFFNPSRSKKIKDIVKLVEKIIDQRFNTDKNVTPIDLTDKSTRLLITAERVFQEAVIALSGENSPKLGIPKARESSWTVGDYWNQRSGTTGYGPKERYQVGSTTMTSEHRTSPKPQRLGDSYLPEHGAYSKDIFPFISKITNNKKEKEQQVAKFLLRYGQKHNPITLDELQAIYIEADEDDVNHFNRICFLILEKEQAQWHSATEQKYQLGMAVAQARCLIMIEAGFISFAEAFKNDVLFGVYSQTEIVCKTYKVANACEHIDALYMVYLQTKHATDYLKFFKQNITEKISPTCVLTREQAHLDLKYVYGGESDTDNEGYDTDIDLSM